MIIPYKISTLVYIRNEAGELLLLQRKKSPNLGLWSSIGGKLEMHLGESPFETAIREVKEETDFDICEEDLHLFSIVAEKGYENSCHWLMFLFDCRKPITYLPPELPEGRLAFHKVEELTSLDIPETDRLWLWPIWLEKREGFTSIRIDCRESPPLGRIEEQSH
ncbi:MAG: NUDIX domain-containing protein [Opitutales bacterium]|nr:NUDIX domain-containing protein [Opitutales bacterium]